MEQERTAKKIGVIFPRLMAQTADGLLKALIEKAKETNDFVFFTSSGDIESEKDVLKQLVTMADGIILISCAQYYSEIRECIPDGYPIAFLLNQPIGAPGTAVIDNDYSAVYQGIIAYLTHGYHRVACITEKSESASAQSRIKGYQDALSSASLYDPALLIEIDNLENLKSSQVFSQIISFGCDSIFCTNCALTNLMTECLFVYNTNKNNIPIPLLGYSVTDIDHVTSLNVDIISHSASQYADIIFPQLIYQINHPEAPEKERVFRLKGTLKMHKYNAMNLD